MNWDWKKFKVELVIVIGTFIIATVTYLQGFSKSEATLAAIMAFVYWKIVSEIGDLRDEINNKKER